jgi:hypothetical protein
MSVKVALGVWLVGVGAWLGLSSQAAAAPWDKLLTVSRVEADSNKTYALTETNGPWLIMACSFCGENAEKQARDLVLELRRRYKLTAYMYSKKFDFGDEAFARVNQFQGVPHKKYQRGEDSEEVAVVVGDFPAIDDPEAQRALREVKSMRPQSLEVKEGGSTTRTLAALREIYTTINKDKQGRGPLAHAMLTTNPMLPRDYYVPKGLDKFVESMNLDNPHNLLNCPGKYTVQVACFRGRVTLEQTKILELERKQDTQSKLVEAGEKAEKLTAALRMKGYEAYVFHDRYASIVTVGSFNSVGTPRPDGHTEINPQVHHIMKTFGAEQVGGGSGAYRRKELVGIQFDVQSIPVEVPRRSISADYQHDVTRNP